MRAPVRSNRFRAKPGRGYSGNPVNRVYDSTGPDGKVRGTPQQIIDKYMMLSRDAFTSGDHVAAENYLQHAEHYARILSTARRMQQQRREERMSENPAPPTDGDAAPSPRRQKEHDGRNGGANGDAPRGRNGRDARAAERA